MKASPPAPTIRKPPRSNAAGIVLALGMLLSHPLHAATVEAEGTAPGDSANAREQALADALREAVRTGVGIDLLGSTGTSGLTFDYDRVIGSAFGHVKSYDVLSSGLGKYGLYSVRIRATVESGTPAAKDSLALREVVLRKGAPRVSIHIREMVDGSPPAPSQAQAFLEASARDLQFHVVESSSAAAWRERNTPTGQPPLQIAGPPPPDSDFIIVGDIEARHVGRQSFYGSNPKNMFAVGGELRAIRPETGEVVVVESLKGSEHAVGIESVELAAREAFRQALAPRKAGEAPAILQKVVARWVVESDLGSVKRLKFSNLPSEEFRKIQSALSSTPKISAVWPRFDAPGGTSIMDVETRLDSGSLGEEVAKASGGRQKIDYASETLLAFRDVNSSMGKSWWENLFKGFSEPNGKE